MSELLEQVLLANIYIQPIQFSLGVIANILNIRVLCSRILRASPCTYYFLAYAVSCIIYTCLACPTQFLRGFHIDWANEKIGCKIHSYVLFVFPFQANLMLILASIDRYCSSSKSRRFHSRSTKRTARKTILISLFFSSIYMSPMLIIYDWNNVSNRCIPNSSTLTFIYICSQLLIFYILTPILIFILGLLTINNIHQQTIRAGPLTASIRGRRTEGQLTRMLILQVTVHMILVLPFGVIYMINSFIPSTRTANILGVRYILVIWQQCDYFVSFFLYVLSGRIYRQQFIRILKSIKQHDTPPSSFVQIRNSIYRELPLVVTTLQNTNGLIRGASV
jgi:uncharacterized membrane protein (DUF485 family)